MVLFDTLKPIISASCKVDNFNSKDIYDRYKFTINLKQLEDNISKTDPTFHILSVNPADSNELHSKSLKASDITNILEYIHKPKDMESFIHDEVNYVEFMIYCTDIKNEELKNQVISYITEEDNNTNPIILPDCTIISDLKDTLIPAIISQFPIYKVLVMRKFNFKKDKFTYSIVFRSNYEMIEYVNDIFPKNKKEVAEENK